MRLIGLNGLKTSGKDTVCSCLQESWPNVQRAAFADKLKIMAAEALGLEEDDKQKLVDAMNALKEDGQFHLTASGDLHLTSFTGRQYLQWFGTAGRKAFHDTFWIDAVLPKPSGHPCRDNREVEDKSNLIRMYPKADVVVVTDVRYPNEAKRVNELGGEMWEVVRPGLKSDGHASEQPLDKRLLKYVINNSGSLDDLSGTVKLAFADLLTA